MNSILMPEEKIRVDYEADVCVLGGSCTGLFAAVRAARLGANVVIVEKQNRFGGVATAGLVGMWHSLFDAHQKQQIIAGLTFEILERLERKNAVSPFRTPMEYGIRFNPEELTLVLDKLALENNLKIYLDTLFTRPVINQDGIPEAVLVENKSGRFAIRAKVFIDATGDALFCSRTGFPMQIPKQIQPPTACIKLMNYDKLPPDFNLKTLIEQFRQKYPALPCGYHWGMYIPGSSMYMLAGTRITHCNPLDGESLTSAELESRAQIDALVSLLRDHYPDCNISIQALPSAIGIRETTHIKSLYQLRGSELMSGTRYPDAIANGTYPVDIHDDASDEISFRYLNGQKNTFRSNVLIREENLLPPGSDFPGFYQIPMRSLVPQGSVNVLTAGRMIDADREAFGAVRVMVNLNQCGEAAGTAAYQLLDTGKKAVDIDGLELRKSLAKGGSVIL